MWQLTCDNDLFDGKPIWLRPSSQHLLGRTSARTESGERVRYIDHKNVSRKHLLIQVGGSNSGDSCHVHVRSTVTATDNSKTGTFVNGTKVLKDKIVLDRVENRLQLGNSEYVFHITWVPVVLTCTNIPKSLKSSDDPLARFRGIFDNTDIKLIASYLSNTTTHVVASKRNNPAVLQALAQAKWPVNYQWLDMLSIATQPQQDGNGDQDELQLSQLERDLQGEWPKEADFLVEPGSEPTPREKVLLQPNPNRAEVFQGLSFVFLLQAQYDNLMPVVTACGGKALLRDMPPDSNDVAAVVEFFGQLVDGRSSSREKQLKDSTEKVILVQPNGAKEDEAEWSLINQRIEAVLGRKSVAQNEFLDIIITLDRSRLSVHLDQTETVQSSLPESVSDSANASVQPTETHVSESRSRWRKPVIQSRFKGFQDFDISQMTRQTSPSPDQSPVDAGMSIDSGDEAAHANDTSQAQNNTLKRKARGHIDIDRELANQFPGMAAMKKQRMANGSAALVEPEDGGQHALGAENSDRQNVKREYNVHELKSKLQAQLQQAEKEQAEQEELLKAQLHDLDLEQYKDCAQVEEYEVQLRPNARSNTATQRQAGRDWKLEWNGRANFKAFRPQGQAHDRTRRPRIFVQLVEASDDAYGPGADEWGMVDEPSQPETSNNGEHSLPTGQGDASFDGTTSYLSRSNGPRQSRAVPQSDTSLNSGSPSVVLETPHGSEALQHAAEKQRGQTLKRQRNSVGKRAAAPLDVDDDDEDGLQFRRKRR